MSESEIVSPLILGTRGSELALAQVRLVQEALRDCPQVKRGVEREIIKTAGDLRQDLKLSEFSKSLGGKAPVLDKGIFVKELENALLARRVHAAVHSLKDVPSKLEEPFAIAAVLPRAAVEDVLISKHRGGMAGLPAGARVGTGSLRRQRQMQALRDDLEIVDLRGNVPTRIRRLAGRDDLDAIMLARAGLERLGFGDLAAGSMDFEGVVFEVEIQDAERFLPAACQGIVGIEILRDDAQSRETIEAINHGDTLRQAEVERAFLRLLQAGCQTPVGVHSWVDRAGGALRVKAVVFDEHDPGRPPRAGEAAGDPANPEALARELMRDLSA